MVQPEKARKRKMAQKMGGAGGGEWGEKGQGVSLLACGTWRVE
jgi:hypothetical protein